MISSISHCLRLLYLRFKIFIKAQEPLYVFCAVFIFFFTWYTLLFPSGYHKPFRHNIQEASSILHARAPEITMANPNLPDFKLHHYQEGVMKNPVLKETIESFPLYVSGETGWHYRLENQKELSKDDNMGKDSVLVMVVFNDENSWGKNDTLTRSMDDFFKLLETFQYPKKKISITMLTSSMSEYNKLREKFMDKIEIYPRLSLIYRNDFMVGSNLNRENRHASSLQNDRRRMLARYRNYALQMTLASWHNHVVWIDADVVVIPNDTLSRMVKSGRDILQPICMRSVDNANMYEYDLNAWAGYRKSPKYKGQKDFVPGDVNVQRLSHHRGGEIDFIPLDSVGGTMLYVKADIHRQGVIFPVHYVIGSEWENEGYDAIETEGICYIAHFLGFKCWGMPNDIIYHI